MIELIRDYCSLCSKDMILIRNGTFGPNIASLWGLIQSDPLFLLLFIFKMNILVRWYQVLKMVISYSYPPWVRQILVVSTYLFHLFNDVTLNFYGGQSWSYLSLRTLFICFEVFLCFVHSTHQAKRWKSFNFTSTTLGSFGMRAMRLH